MILKRPFSNLLLLIVLSNMMLCPLRAEHHHSLEEQLVYADSIRTINPIKFTEIIESLATQRDELSENSQYHLDYLIGLSLMFKGDGEGAKLVFDKVIESNAEPGIKLRASHGVVTTSLNTRKWAIGLEYLSKGFSFLELVNDPQLKETHFGVAATIYNGLGQYEQGLVYITKLVESATSQRNKCGAETVLIETKIKLNMMTPQDKNFDYVIELCKSEPMMANFTRSYKAGAYISLGRYEDALAILNGSIKEVEAIGYLRLSSEFYSLMSKAFFSLGDDDSALLYAKKTVENTKGLATSEATAQSYMILASIFEKRGKLAEALRYFKSFSRAQLAHSSDEQNKMLAYQLAKYKAVEQESEIKLLDEQNNLLRVENKLAEAQSENNRLFIFLLIVICSLTTLFAYRSWQSKVRMRRMAEHDALTGVYSRAHFIQLANSALKYCEKTQQSLALILFDLDNFKKINDSYGHGCGDWPLKKVAEVCQSHVRKSDLFSRIGGEEFCLVLPSNDLKDALLLAEKCRQAIEAIDTTESGFDFNVSASFGVTDVSRSEYKLAKLTADADKAMYQSKRNGRNQVSSFQLDELIDEELSQPRLQPAN